MTSQPDYTLDKVRKGINSNKMGFDDFWLQSNNGKKKYSLKNLKDFKPDDIAKNPKFKKMIELFKWDSDGDGKISVRNSQGKNEWKSVFADLQEAAVDDDLTREEFGLFISKKIPDGDIKLEDVENFLDAASKPGTENVTKIDNKTIIRKNGIVTIKIEPNITILAKKVNEEGQVAEDDLLEIKTVDSEGKEITVKREEFKTKNGTIKLIAETKKLNNKESITSIYNTSSFCFYEMLQGQESSIAMESYKKGDDEYFVQYREGETITHAANGDGLNSLIKKFGFKDAEEFYKSNPELKGKTIKVGEPVTVPGRYSANSKEILAQGTVSGEYYAYIKDVRNKEVEKFRQEHLNKINKELFYTLDKIQGFEFNNENSEMYFKINSYGEKVQKSVINYIQKLTKEGKTPEDIKNAFLYNNDAPKIVLKDGSKMRINLFDGYLISLNGFKGKPLSKDLSIKHFVTEELELDINKGEGKELYNKLLSIKNPDKLQDLMDMFSAIKLRTTSEYASYHLSEISKCSESDAYEKYNMKKSGRHSSSYNNNQAYKQTLLDNKPLNKNVAKEMYKAVINKLSAKNPKEVQTKYDSFIKDHMHSKERTFAAMMLSQMLLDEDAQLKEFSKSKSILNPTGKAASTIARYSTIYNWKKSEEVENGVFIGNKRIDLLLKLSNSKDKVNFDVAKVRKLMQIQETISKKNKPLYDKISKLEKEYEKATDKKRKDEIKKEIGDIYKTLSESEPYKSLNKQYQEALTNVFGKELVDGFKNFLSVLDFIDGGVDMAMMLLGTQALGKLIAKGAMLLIPRAVQLSSTAATAITGTASTMQKVGSVAFPILSSGITFPLWDGIKYTTDYYTNDIDETQMGEASYTYSEGLKNTAKHSIAFGIFAGAWGQLTGYGLRLIFKTPAGEKLMEKTCEYLSKECSASGGFTSAEVRAGLNKVRESMAKNWKKTTARFGGEVFGFSMYEVASNIASGIYTIDENGNLYRTEKTANGVEFQSEMSYLEVGWEQCKTLLSFKALGQIVFIRRHEGGMDFSPKMPKEQELQIKPVTKDGKTTYEVKYPDGTTRNVKDMQDVIKLSNIHYEDITLYKPLAEILEKKGKMELRDGIVITKENEGYKITLKDGTEFKANNLRSAMGQAQGEYLNRSYEKELREKGQIELPNNQIVTFDKETNTFKTVIEDGVEVEAFSFKDLMQEAQMQRIFQSIENSFTDENKAIMLDESTLIEKQADGKYCLIVIKDGFKKEIYGTSVEDVLIKFEKLNNGLEIEPEIKKPIDVRISELNMTESDRNKLTNEVRNLQAEINELRIKNPEEAEKLQKQLNAKVKGEGVKDGVNEGEESSRPTAPTDRIGVNSQILNQSVKISPAKDGEGFVIKIDGKEFTAKGFDEVESILKSKVSETSNIDLSDLELKDDLCAGSDASQTSFIITKSSIRKKVASNPDFNTKEMKDFVEELLKITPHVAKEPYNKLSEKISSRIKYPIRQYSNLKLINEVLSNEVLYKNENLRKNLLKESIFLRFGISDVQLKILRAYTQNPKYQQSTFIQEHLGDIIRCCDNPRINKENPEYYFDKFLNLNEEQLNFLNEHARTLFGGNGLASKLCIDETWQVLEIILNHEQLYKNEKIASNVSLYFSDSCSKANYLEPLQILDKYFRQENRIELDENNIVGILNGVWGLHVDAEICSHDQILSEGTRELYRNIINEIFNNPIFANNENVMKNVGKIVNSGTSYNRGRIQLNKLDLIELYKETWCNDKEISKYIGEILGNVQHDNKELIIRLIEDKNFPKNRIAELVEYANEDNKILVETLIKITKDLKEGTLKGILNATLINDPNDDGGNNGKVDPKKLDRYSMLLQNPKTQAWAINMLNEGWDIETVSKLNPTKQGFYTEKPTTSSSKPIDENTQFFMDFGMEEKQATSIVKAISKEGVINNEMQQVAIQLINSGVASNRIAEIINSSNITGKHEPKIIEDALKIKDLKINPLLLKNLPVLNNIDEADVAVKFNQKIKKSLKAMLGSLDENTKSQLEQLGFNIESINTKLDSQIVRTATNSPQPQGKVVSGMRTKSSITGFEKIVVDKYEPIETVWRSEENCKKWAEEKYSSIKNQEYQSTRTGEHVDVEEINKQRKEGLKQWFDFMESEPEIKDNPFIKVILSEYITKDLLPENSSTPPTLDKQLVKKVLSDALKTGSVSFEKSYNAKLNENAKKSSGALEVEIGGRKMTWYTVPKTDSSHPDFKNNAAKVRAFSDGTNWCIRTWNAEPYIQKGDIHFLVDETGLTQVCIREDGTNHIAEIQRRQQNATIPVAYIDFIQDFVGKKGLNGCEEKINQAVEQKPLFELAKTELQKLLNSITTSEELYNNAIKQLKEPNLTDEQKEMAQRIINSTKNAKKQAYRQILEAMGIEVKELDDGTFEISHYSPIFRGNVLNDYGVIKENDLLSNVSIIRGNATFKDSNVTSLPNLREVGGTFDFGYADISNLRSLEKINGKKITWNIAEANEGGKPDANTAPVNEKGVNKVNDTKNSDQSVTHMDESNKPVQNPWITKTPEEIIQELEQNGYDENFINDVKQFKLLDSDIGKIMLEKLTKENSTSQDQLLMFLTEDCIETIKDRNLLQNEMLTFSDIIQLSKVSNEDYAEYKKNGFSDVDILIDKFPANIKGNAVKRKLSRYRHLTISEIRDLARLSDDEFTRLEATHKIETGLVYTSEIPAIDDLFIRYKRICPSKSSVAYLKSLEKEIINDIKTNSLDATSHVEKVLDVLSNISQTKNIDRITNHIFVITSHLVAKGFEINDVRKFVQLGIDEFKNDVSNEQFPMVVSEIKSHKEYLPLLKTILQKQELCIQDIGTVFTAISNSKNRKQTIELFTQLFTQNPKLDKSCFLFSDDQYKFLDHDLEITLNSPEALALINLLLRNNTYTNKQKGQILGLSRDFNADINKVIERVKNNYDANSLIRYFTLEIPKYADALFDKISYMKTKEGHSVYSNIALSEIFKRITSENDVARLEKALSENQLTTKEIITFLEKGTLPAKADAEPFEGFIDKIREMQVFKDYPDSSVTPTVMDSMREVYNKDPKNFGLFVEVFDMYAKTQAHRTKPIGTLGEIVRDKKVLSESLLKDLKKQKDGVPLISRYNSNISLDEVVTRSQNGDIVSRNNELYLVNNGKASKINLIAETFEKLFPLGTRFSSHQGHIGDCWLVKAIDSTMNNVEGQSKIYDLFKQEGNDIIVTIPNKDGNGSYSVRFKNGFIYNGGVTSCKGIELLETAFALSKRGEKTSNETVNYQDIIKSEQEHIDILKKNIESGNQSEFIHIIWGVKNYSKPIPFAVVLDNEDIYQEIEVDGKIIAKRTGDTEQMIQWIEEYANKKDVLLNTATVPGTEDYESTISKEDDLFHRHAYEITGYDVEKGLVYYKNPWHCNFTSSKDIYNFIEHVYYVEYFDTEFSTKSHQNRVNEGVNPDGVITDIAHSVTNSIKKLTGKKPEQGNLVGNLSNTNPGEKVAGKIKREWTEKDLTTRTDEQKPVDLFNLDPYAGLSERGTEVYDEVTSLVLHGKLESQMKQRYQTAKILMENIIINHFDKISSLAEKYPSDMEKFAQGVIHILAKEMNFAQIEPRIVINSTISGAGRTAYEKGTIYINPDMVKTASDVVQILGHEFTHFMQIRDFVSTQGENGLREMLEGAGIKNDKVDEFMQYEYIQKLLSDKESETKTGSLEDYLSRVYLRDAVNGAGAKIGTQKYTDKLSELEAYYIGNNAVDGLAEWDTPISADGTKVRKREELKRKLLSDNRTESTINSRINADGTIVKHGSSNEVIPSVDERGVHEVGNPEQPAAPVDTKTIKESFISRMDNARTNAEFTAIRNEIAVLEDKALYKELFNEYVQRFQQWTLNPQRNRAAANSSTQSESSRSPIVKIEADLTSGEREIVKIVSKLFENQKESTITIRFDYLKDKDGNPIKDAEIIAAVATKEGITINKYFLENLDNRVFYNVENCIKEQSIYKDKDEKYRISSHLRNENTIKIEEKLNNYDSLTMAEKFDFCTSEIAYLKNLSFQTTKFPIIAIETILKNENNVKLLKSKNLYKDAAELDKMEHDELTEYLKQITKFVHIPTDVVLENYSGIVLIHEDGHIKHRENMTDEQINDFNNVYINIAFTLPHIQAIAAKVSARACDSPKEFVAEVYSGLKHGQKFSKDVMDLYEQYHGPKVDGVNDGVNANNQGQPVTLIIEGVNKSSNPKLAKYINLSNKIFNITPEDVMNNHVKITEVQNSIDELRQNEPEQADELQIVLDMYTKPTKDVDITDNQFNAVAKYIHNVYNEDESTITSRVKNNGLNNYGNFTSRIKSVESTKVKLENFIKDAIEDGESVTLLDAFKDIRDEYACRTEFDIGDFAHHPEVIKILENGNYSPEAKRAAELRAAEIQSQPMVNDLIEMITLQSLQHGDLAVMRLTNYTSKNGISIFSPRQMQDLVEAGLKKGIQVDFLKPVDDIDPLKRPEFKSATKYQPTGYMAVQVNFITVDGKVIEWQYRGVLSGKLAESEHPLYDLRTGKCPWALHPELENLYKPLGDLVSEKAMPDGAYKNHQQYLTDYNTHLRRLELGFESEAPKLEDYEVYVEKGVEYRFKFDKRLTAENLMKLDDIAKKVTADEISKENAVDEYHKLIGE